MNPRRGRERVTSSVVRFFMLGALDLQSGDGTELRSVLAQPRRVALLVYLALATPRGPHRRDRMLGLFWPDHDEAHARNALSQAVYFLRNSLGADAIASRTPEELALDANVVWCDAVAFDAAIDARRYTEAIELYRGELLAGFHVTGAGPEFNEWLDSMRATYAQHYESALRTIAAERESARDYAGAVTWRRRLAAHDPLNSDAALHLMRALVAAGDPAAAIRHARVHETLLRDQLDAPPDAKIGQFVKALQESPASVVTSLPSRAESLSSQRASVSAPTETDSIQVPATVAPHSVKRSGSAHWYYVARSVGLAAARWVLPAGALLLLILVAAMWREFEQLVPVTVGMTTPVAVGPDVQTEPAISPDGKLVAYSATTPGGSRIFIRQVDGGGARMLAPDLELPQSLPKWSPDGSRVSFLAKFAIYAAPALVAGTTRRIVDSAWDHAWMPDGSAIVYASSDLRSIRLQSLDGSASRLIVSGTDIHTPSVSPDGKRMLYVQGVVTNLGNVASYTAIRCVSLAGGKSTLVSDSVHVNLSPIWAPDEKSVLFISDLGGARDVYQVPMRNGSPRGNPVRLTTGLSAFWISLSADGSRMAYDVVRAYANVFVAPLDGGVARLADAKPVTRDNQHIESLALSHDGNWIAFDSDRGGNFDIYKQRVDGGDPIQLTTSPANEFAPEWSADDKQITYHSSRSGTRDIYITDSDGNNPRQVSSGPREDFHPAFSPDGRALVYTSRAGTGDSIYLIERDAHDKWTKPVALLGAGPNQASWAIWSVDGRQLFAAIAGNVVAYTIAGHSSRVILNGQSIGFSPVTLSMDRKGSTIFCGGYVTRDFVASMRGMRPASIAVYSVPIAGGSPHLVLAETPGMRLPGSDIATDDRRIFFIRSAWESNVWVMQLKR